MFTGSFNDASIFMASDLYTGIEEESLNIPKPTVLEGSDIFMPYFFVGDSIFALHKNLMKPYAQTEHLTRSQEHFNYRISRARINIECAFGILTTRWRIFERPLGMKVETVELIIMATVLLHNFIITLDLNTGKGAEGYSDYQHQPDRTDYVDEVDDRACQRSEIQRQKLQEYLISPAGRMTQQNRKRKRKD